MVETKFFISQFLSKHRKDIINLTSELVKIKSYSSQEKEVIRFLVKYIRKFPYGFGINFDIISNNLLIKIGSGDRCLLYDAHVDTVPVTDDSKWKYSPFSGKVVGEKIYGRGSCDDKGCVAALLFTAFALNKYIIEEKKFLDHTIFFSFSSNEEDSTGRGIEEVLKKIKPTFAVICEPSNLKIVVGHKGKFAFKTTFYGKASHSSVPHLGRNAIYMAVPFVKNVEMLNLKSRKINLLGKATTTVTFLETKTNSFNSVPYESCVYVDYRGVVKEREDDIVRKFVKVIPKEEKKFVKTEFLHRYFSPWILEKNHYLLKAAKKTFYQSFDAIPTPIFWPFCTNGSITMGDKNIPTIGFGAGEPHIAHTDDEYIEIPQILNSIKFYFLLPFNL